VEGTGVHDRVRNELEAAELVTDLAEAGKGKLAAESTLASSFGLYISSDSWFNVARQQEKGVF
jgi:hypothetical protein